MARPRITFDADALAVVCGRWHVRRLSLFGSVLRDDFGPDSDVDVLVEFEPGTAPGMFGYFRLRDELAALVPERKVDLLTPGFLSPYLRADVVESAVVQFAA